MMFTGSGFSLTWYVLSKLSYMNLVMRDVFPTATEHTVNCENVSSKYNTDVKTEVVEYIE